MNALWQGLWTALGADAPAPDAAATAAVTVTPEDKDLWETWGPLIIDYGIKIVGVFAIFIVGRWVASKLGAFVERRLEKRNFDKTLTRFFAGLVRSLIMIVVLLACLNIFGIDTTSLAAIIGASALAIGIALQGSLSNFAAGIMLVIFRPYRIGDLVEVAGELGVVFEIGLFTTKLDSLTNKRIVVPNGTIFGGNIENLTHNELRRVDVSVGVEYKADVDTTRKVLETVIAEVPSRAEGAPHQIFLKGLGGSSVDWEVRIWGKATEYWDVYQETVRATKYALDKAKLGIPFPQMDVHLDGHIIQRIEPQNQKSA